MLRRYARDAGIELFLIERLPAYRLVPELCQRSMYCEPTFSPTVALIAHQDIWMHSEQNGLVSGPDSFLPVSIQKRGKSLAPRDLTSNNKKYEILVYYCMHCCTFICAVLLQVFKLTVFLLLNYVEGDSIQAEFLRSNRRLLTSTYIDSYFCCNACGGGIQWLVNGEDAGGHLPSQKSGSLSYRTEFSDSTALRYTSVLLSSRSENDIICMDVVLLVTQLEAEYFSSPPLVICRGPTLQREIQTPTQQLVPDQRNNGTVSLTYVLSRSNIVSPGNNFVTHILLCSTNESAQFWLRNQLPAGGFNGIHSAGYSEFTLHSNDSSISFQEAVLLVKRPQVDLTSLLLLTDFNSSTNFSVLCVSNTNYVLSVINDSYSYLEELNADSASSVSTDSATIKTGTTDELTKTSGSSETATHDMENFLTGNFYI